MILSFESYQIDEKIINKKSTVRFSWIIFVSFILERVVKLCLSIGLGRLSWF